MKIDIFGSRSNKNLLLAFLARSIDHWPYDASFRYEFLKVHYLLFMYYETISMIFFFPFQICFGNLAKLYPTLAIFKH